MHRLCRVFFVVCLAVLIEGCDRGADSETIINSTEAVTPPTQVENQGAPPSRSSAGGTNTADESEVTPEDDAESESDATDVSQ